MKKSLLLILASLFAIFALAGCAEEEKSETPAETSPTVVPIDPASNPAALTDLLGHYEITFFHTNGGGMLSVSTDCNQVAYWTGSADTKCVQGTNNVEMKGYGTVLLSEDKQYINIITKMHNPVEVIDPSNIKVVFDENMKMTYTSRTPIPYPYKTLDFDYYKHVGIIGYNKKMLDFYAQNPPGKFELIEGIATLRFVDYDKPLMLKEAENVVSLSVDTPKDLDVVINLVKQKIANNELSKEFLALLKEEII